MNLSQKTILVVEDEKSLREAIVETLTLRGFLCLEARNGNEGVNLAFLRHPDLILLDLIMPTMDGSTALQMIRDNSWGATVPIIILTNLSETNGHLTNSAIDHTLTHHFIKSDKKIHDIVRKVEEILAL